MFLPRLEAQRKTQFAKSEAGRPKAKLGMSTLRLGRLSWSLAAPIETAMRAERQKGTA
jgi:hypothetical protein